MTTTTGPVRLIVVSLCCKTSEQRCLHHSKIAGVHYCGIGINGATPRRIDGIITRERVPTPEWCPLNPKV